MQINFSLILNLILFVMVINTIRYLLKNRKNKNTIISNYQPSLGEANKFNNDIIAVRKINVETTENTNAMHKMNVQESDTVAVSATIKPIIMLIAAKEQQQFTGYELLQTILTNGLRFGDGHIFHHHQQANGQGPIVFSLAAATPSGIFDLQNIGAFCVKGLCLFMQTATEPEITLKNFNTMYDVANKLSTELNAILLDENRHLFNTARFTAYQQQLGTCTK